MQMLFELLLQPILKLVFYVIGYGTGWVLVPLFTLGVVTVEPGPTRGGRFVMKVELAAWIGLVFWILLIGWVCFLR